MAFSLPLLIIGILGFVVFIVTGVLNVIPWVVSGPFALAFLGLMIAEFREYFQRAKEKPRLEPVNMYASVKPSPEKEKEKETKRKPRAKPEPVTSEDSPLEETVQVPAKSSVWFQIVMKMGETLSASVGADDWIGVELQNKSGDIVRNKDGKNINIQFGAPRNGNWFLYIFNNNTFSLEVGVTLTVEAS